MDAPTSAPGWSRLFLLTSIGLAILVVLLAWQNRQLKHRLADLGAPAGTLQAGQRIGAIELLDVDGRSAPLVMDPNGRHTLLLFFTPTCPACRETIPTWQTMVPSLGAGSRIVGIDLAPDGVEGAREKLGADTWPFPVYRVAAAGSPGLTAISWVPATVVVDGAGSVERVWFGPLDQAQQDELRTFFAPDAALLKSAVR